MNFYKDFDFKKADSLIALALEEDKGKGDITFQISSSQEQRIQLLKFW